MAIEYITFADLEQLDKQLRQVETYLDQNCPRAEKDCRMDEVSNLFGPSTDHAAI